MTYEKHTMKTDIQRFTIPAAVLTMFPMGYRKYRVDWDNNLLKVKIDRIRDGYENYEDDES